MSTKHVVMAFSIVVLWGLNFVTLKIVVLSLPPIFLAGLRFFLISFPWIFFVPKPKVIDKTFSGKNQTDGKKLFEYLLIPRYKGEYTIPSANLIVYNPKSKKYETKKSNSHKLSIRASKNNEQEINETNQQNLILYYQPTSF